MKKGDVLWICTDSAQLKSYIVVDTDPVAGNIKMSKSVSDAISVLLDGDETPFTASAEIFSTSRASAVAKRIEHLRKQQASWRAAIARCDTIIQNIEKETA